MEEYIKQLLTYQALVHSTVKLNLDMYHTLKEEVIPTDANGKNLYVLLNHTLVLAIDNVGKISEMLDSIYSYDFYLKEIQRQKQNMLDILEETNDRTYTFNVDDLDQAYKDECGENE